MSSKKHEQFYDDMNIDAASNFDVALNLCFFKQNKLFKKFESIYIHIHIIGCILYIVEKKEINFNSNKINNLVLNKEI